MNAYKLYGVKVNTTSIGGIQSQAIDNRIQEYLGNGSGRVDPTYAAILNTEPLLSFSTTSIAAGLTAVPFAGADASSFLFGFQAVAGGGTRASTFAHATAYDGLAIPRRITATQGQEALLDVDVFAVGDTSNEPLSVATTTISITGTVTEAFTVGPASINGTEIDAQSITVDFGIQYKTESHSGYAWPILGYIDRREPTITIRTLDMSKWATLQPDGAGGLAVTAGIVYLRKMAEGGTFRVADGTAQHCKFTVTDGIATASTAGGEHSGEAALDITIKPVYDGSNDIIQISTASAIT